MDTTYINIDELKFDEKGLIPAVVMEAGTHKLLMVAWMNRESLEKSIETGLTCFWSRSRQELWTKGETSGNLQHIVSITADCDSDTLQVIVKKDGPACHTGSESCFFKPLWDSDTLSDFSLEDLMEIIKNKKANGFDSLISDLMVIDIDSNHDGLLSGDSLYEVACHIEYTLKSMRDGEING